MARPLTTVLGYWYILTLGHVSFHKMDDQGHHSQICPLRRFCLFIDLQGDPWMCLMQFLSIFNLFPHTKLIHLKTKLRLFPPSSLDVMGHLHMATVASLRKESSELGDMGVWATCSCPAYSCPLVIFGLYPTWNISILVQATTSNSQNWSLGMFNKTQMIMNTWSSDAMIKCF